MNRRPRLTLLGHSASPEEAAAVVAAIEQFMRDTAPPPVPVEDRPDPWQRAGRLEAAAQAGDSPSPWGDPHPWR